ncbi:MAG TPA: 50S ribosomal protein L9, partial [Acidimicrobiales bacterium]|nr:50S ribosomal protein L9 [Acidimicrobiales bacterium]
MQVVLRSDVEGLGKRGDIVKVARGYARNYLLPTGAALAATDGVTQQASAMRRARDLRDAKDREAAESVAAAVGAINITVRARAGAEGRLFGSVTAADISEAIREQTGAVVDRRKIHLEEPIKSI